MNQVEMQKLRRTTEDAVKEDDDEGGSGDGVLTGAEIKQQVMEALEQDCLQRMVDGTLIADVRAALEPCTVLTPEEAERITEIEKRRA